MTKCEPNSRQLCKTHSCHIMDCIDLREAEIAQITRERDLAIAHDRQLYPTAHAYEQVCKALEMAKARLAALEGQTP